MLKYFNCLKTDVDPKPFLDEISGTDGAWDQSIGRQDKIQVQRKALAIPLRGLHKSAISSRKRRDVHESRLATGSKPCVEARRFLEEFSAETALPSCGHNFRNCVTRGGLDRIVVPDHHPLPQAKTCTGNCGRCAMADATAQGSPI